MNPELPREIQNMIIRKLDIDTRRSLGIYTKLKVPPFLEEKLKQLPKAQITDENSIVINLHLSPGKMYQLVRYICEDVLIDFRVIHTSPNDMGYYLIWTVIDDDV